MRTASSEFALLLQKSYSLPYASHEPDQIAVILNGKRYDTLENLHKIQNKRAALEVANSDGGDHSSAASPA
jgi:hypothetical protein